MFKASLLGERGPCGLFSAMDKVKFVLVALEKNPLNLISCLLEDITNFSLQARDISQALPGQPVLWFCCIHLRTLRLRWPLLDRAREVSSSKAAIALLPSIHSLDLPSTLDLTYSQDQEGNSLPLYLRDPCLAHDLKTSLALVPSAPILKPSD